MPSYYRVSPKFWTDPVVRRASDDARLLALYLLTSPHRRLEGLFRLPKPYICADLGWSAERLDKPFGELLETGFIRYDEAAEVVLIRNALKYQSPANDNMVTAALDQLEEVPETSLDQEFQQLAKRYCERLAQRLPERFGRPMPKPPAPAPAPAPTPEEEHHVGTADADADAESKSSDVQVVHFRPDVDRLCELLADGIQTTTGERPKVNKRWHDACRLLLDTDGYNAKQVEALIVWSQNHDFWRSNILSMPKLREKRLQLIAQIRRDTTPKRRDEPASWAALREL